MAHEDCLTTDGKLWTSEFKNPDAPDGEIEIEEVSNKLEGTHLLTKAPLKNIVCDGKNISFSRVDAEEGVEVFYEDGKITKTVDKVKIKGKFRRVPLPVDSEAGRTKKGKKKKTDTDIGNDWEAEKPIA